MDRSRKIYSIVSKIPQGKVMTYGQIAQATGINPRLVGSILHGNTDPETIPCHRVVNVRGEVAQNYAFGGGKVQGKKLKLEGVKFVGSRVDLKKCLCKRNS